MTLLLLPDMAQDDVDTIEVHYLPFAGGKALIH